MFSRGRSKTNTGAVGNNSAPQNRQENEESEGGNTNVKQCMDE